MTYSAATASSHTVPVGLFPHKVWINPDALLKLNMYATAALPTEIGGLAKIVQDEEGNVFIEDVHMFKQEASGAYFTFSADEMNKFTLKLLKEGRQDEIPLWRSIVHSHPVGMGPSMSGVDVSMLENFSHEQDAFSLIITASKDASSRRLYMHYCTNADVCGVNKKIVIRDIPVLISMSQRQIELRDALFHTAVATVGKDSFSDDDAMKLAQSIQEFVLNKIPLEPNKNRDKLQEEIAAHVKELITTRVYTPSAVPNGNGATKPQTTSTSLPNIRMNGNSASDIERMTLIIERLYSIWSFGFDPMNENAVISKTMGKNARKLWYRAILQVNKIIRPLEGVGIGDSVAINHKAKNHADFSEKVYEVLSYLPSDKGAGAFEVANEVFMAHELDLEETFERYWESTGDKASPVFWGVQQDEVADDPDGDGVIFIPKEALMEDDSISDGNPYPRHHRIVTETGMIKLVPKSKFDSTGRELVPIH